MSTTATGNALIEHTPFQVDITQAATTSRQTEGTNDLAVDGSRRKQTSRISERFRRDREKTYSGRTNSELIRLLIREEHEARDTQRLLHLALDRLERESQRVTEAERRVLEMAERFQALNEARLASQQAATEATTELNLYKFQYRNAQQEISRAQDILKEVEEQRDDAEADAASARDAARRFREQQLILAAKEEGRRMGYKEGLQYARYGYGFLGAIGYEDRQTDSRSIITNRLIADEPYNDTLGDGLLEEEGLSPYLDLKALPPTPYTGPAARKASRSRSTPEAAPLSPISIPLNSSQPVTPSISQAEIAIAPIHKTPTSIHHPGSPMSLQREFERPSAPSPTSIIGETAWATPHRDSPSDRNTLETLTYPGVHRRTLSSPITTPISPSSTTFSQFDLIAAGPEHEASPRGRKLSIIKEASIRGDFTPDVSERRSRTEALTTPGLETDYGYSPGTDLTLRSPAVAEFADASKAYVFKPGDPRSRNSMQRFADELRYSDPDLVETWRRDGAEELSPTQPPRRRPPYITRPAPLSPTSAFPSKSLSQSRTPSSKDSRVPIVVQSPSTHESYGNERPQSAGMLSPYTFPLERPVSSTSDDSSSAIVPKSISLDGLQISHPVIDASRRSTAYVSGSQTPRAPSPKRESRDKRRSKSTSREPLDLSQNPYAKAPIPEGFNYPSPPKHRFATKNAPQIAMSQSTGSVRTNSPQLSVGHDRSLSMNAGMTPAHVGKSLRVEDNRSLRNTPSIDSNMSGSVRSAYKPYNPNEYVDPAFLASSHDLLTTDTAAVPAPRSKSASRNGKWSFLS